MADPQKFSEGQQAKGSPTQPKGPKKRFCPICKNYADRFDPAGVKKREDSKCPSCGARERHRLLWLYLTERTDLFDGRKKSVLHVAPERCLCRLIEPIPGVDYVSADLRRKSAKVQMDITDIAFRDDYFDVILCSHVLEHIPDDRKAMSELFRVLKPGGWAILQVPLGREKTFEDPTVTSPEERLRLFGHVDHVRRYGKDFKERLESAGFQVKVDDCFQNMDKKKRELLGLKKKMSIYFCTNAS